MFLELAVGLSKLMFELDTMIDELEITIERRDLRLWEKQQLAEFNDHVGQRK